MRMKRMAAMLLTLTLLAGNAALPCFAATSASGPSAPTASLDLSALTNGNLSVSQKADGSYTFTLNGKDWNFGLDQKETVKMTGIVNVPSGSCLRLRESPNTNAKILAGVNTGTQVDVLSKEGDWYKVAFKDKTGYMHGDYLKVTETKIQENSSNEELFKLLIGLLSQAQQSGTSTSGSNPSGGNTGLTPPGNMTLLDDLGSQNGKGQQFITLVTKSGNTFYLVIDRDADGKENVHFLNLVDELDLFALLDDDAKNQYQEQQKPKETEPEPTLPPPTTEPTPDNIPEKKTNTGPLFLLGLLGFGGIGFAGYHFLSRKKQEASTETFDPDADYLDEEDDYDFPEDDLDEELDTEADDEENELM